MNITELDSYNLADAVKFHNRLNPKIWGKDEHLLPEVKQKLLEIAADFQEFLGIDDLAVEDITVSGSNAAYSYTPHSDIDLHLVVRMPENADEVYQELFNAKKYQYNDLMDIKIHGADVELYVQPADEAPVSLGEYSIKNNDWIQVPRKKRAKIDHSVVKHKYEDLKARIETALKEDDSDRVQALINKIKAMRQSGLDEHGEFGAENLAFKMLRSQGYIKKLYDHRAATRARELSLKEQNKPKERFRYGFGEGHQGQPYSSEDGVAPTTCMFLNEDDTAETIVNQFIVDTAKRLGIEKMPTIELHSDDDWSTEHHSFGMYEPETHTLHVNLNDRHILDILRTTAHELAHCRQNEISKLPPEAGETGSRWENEAHAIAGEIMRDYADANPEMFKEGPVNENASGYIPKNKKEARDPRYSMAVTVDIKPGQVGKEANKLALNTGKNGEPALLMKSANLQESLAAEFEAFSEGKSYGYGSTPLTQVPGEIEDELGNQEATGPEFPPQMPAGTTKIDVSDLTDWYRLGMDISDMDDADPEDYNQGPPQTVIVFPSDEAEQGYLKQFKRLGLKTHDMDPDVKGGEDVTGKHMHKALAEELAKFKEQDLFEIKMTSKNLAKLASDIKGAKVGLEFEMIVPNASVEDDGDMEPDYDQDERVRDIDDAVNFFDDGDYNGSGQIRRLRDQMYEDYWTWRSEQVDNDFWNGDGFEYFKDYLDREEPFDEEEAEEEARNQLQSEYGDELDTEEFEKMLFALVEEKRESYAQEQWDDQGSNFDAAREEYEEENRDNYSEQDWLENQGIRYASDVESSYGGDVTWPYYTSNSGDGEADIERIALEFMNDSGLPYDSVAVSSSYHGRYKKWVGNGWVDIGSEKPDDCFAIEPDGSLEGNSSDDVGLEFVSPPIPLDQVGDVMSKVQQWAASNGVYTGKSNKTSMHTNISVPGYDLDNLDYLKAALLLGDEYVLREFDRIGNSYAKPAIEKIKNLVNQKPEKAKELLDKMKSQLNAAASKLIHSGQTDKFTSINTKGNRVEFRSPGGDYLSDIADNPKKMQDMVNRMVVTLDAAMDPNKYKEEYQKKLYKMLTGQQFGREAKSGAKQEAKKDDKDLLNIFSRYAAGELPKAALKSFVRQAQLQRNVDKGKQTGKMWWRVDKEGRGSPNGTSMEVVASSKEEAIDKAASEWGFFSPQYRNRMDAYPVRPYQEPPAGSELERIERDAGVGQQGSGLYKIFDANGTLIAGDEYGSDRAALARAGVWAMRRGVDVVVKNDQGQEIGRVSASGEITPTAQQPAQQDQGNWGIWIDGNNRFANQPGQYARGADVPLMRFPSREAAEQWLEQQRAARPNLRTDIDVREIAPRLLPGSTLDLQRQRAAQAQSSEYELYRISDGRAVTAPAGNPIVFRADSPEDAESKIARYAADFNLGAPQLFAVRSVLQPVSNINLFPEIGTTQQDTWSQDFERRMQNPAPVEPRTEFGAGTADAAQGGIVDVAGEQFTGEWKVVDPNGREIYRFSGVGNSQSDANNVAIRWLQQNPRHMQGGVEVLPVMG